MPTAAPPPQAPERLASLIDGLCVAVAARGIRGVLTAPLLFLLWGRLRRAAIRVRRLAARIAAGQPLASPRRPAGPRPGRPPPPRLPRGFAWLVRAVPAAASSAAQLQFLMNDPVMAELAHAPPMRRVVRPLCQMLGVPPPPVPRRPAPVAPLTPAPSNDAPAPTRVKRPGRAASARPVSRRGSPPPPSPAPGSRARCRPPRYPPRHGG